MRIIGGMLIHSSKSFKLWLVKFGRPCNFQLEISVVKRIVYIWLDIILNAFQNNGDEVPISCVVMSGKAITSQSWDISCFRSFTLSLRHFTCCSYPSFSWWLNAKQRSVIVCDVFCTKKVRFQIKRGEKYWLANEDVWTLRIGHIHVLLWGNLCSPDETYFLKGKRNERP